MQLELRGGTGDDIAVLDVLGWAGLADSVNWLEQPCSPSFFSLDQQASQDVFLWLRWKWERQVETCRVSLKA